MEILTIILVSLDISKIAIFGIFISFFEKCILLLIYLIFEKNY